MVGEVDVRIEDIPVIGDYRTLDKEYSTSYLTIARTGYGGRKWGRGRLWGNRTRVFRDVDFRSDLNSVRCFVQSQIISRNCFSNQMRFGNESD